MKITSANPYVLPRSRRLHELGEHVPGELLVKLKAGLDVSKFAADHGFGIAEQIFMPPAMKASFGGELLRVKMPQANSTAEAIARVEADPRVAYAEPNHIVHPEPATLAYAPHRLMARPEISQPDGLPALISAARLPVAALSRKSAAGPSPVGVGLVGAALLGATGALLGNTTVAVALGIVVGGGVGIYLAKRCQQTIQVREQEARLREQEAEPPATRSIPVNFDPKLWGLDNLGQNDGKIDADIDAPEAWAITTGDRNRVIAVLDTGIDCSHPALAGNLWTNPVDGTHGFNAITGSHDPHDNVSHGTHCSGTIAANGTDGVFGVSPQAQLMAIKFMDVKDDKGKESGTLADAIKAVALATEHGAKITSNSWTVGWFNRALKEAYAASPALHVMAAGNEGQEAPLYPAAFGLKNSLAVAATDRHNQLAPCSNYGSRTVDLAAPGAEIYSTVPGGGYETKTGTSMATAQVTGVANLVLSAYPDLTTEELKERMLNSATLVRELRPHLRSGAVINAARALRPE